ncbi:MAG: threonine/serine exporter family protein, partial [Pseudolabrys sp.]
MPSTPKSSATSHLTTNDDAPTVALSEATEVLLWFGALMMRAGNTAARTREWIEVLTRKMGFEDVSVSFSLDSIAASVRCGGKRVTTMREIEPPGINAWRIAELEQLARTVGPRPAPRDVAARLAKIESTVPRYSSVPIATAVGAASASFAFLNGAGTREMIAAAIGGGIGQWLRLWMSHHQFNQYGAAALSAIVASGIYVLVAMLARYAGFSFAHYPAGFIASVLFLIPGFPLIAGLFDLLQYQTVAAVSRLAYGVMILLVVAFGLSIVVELARIDLSRQPPLELIYPLKLLLRAVASFAAGGAFAMLFNSPPRAILAAGALALGANSLRLVLNDMGMMIAPASFFAALAIGLVAVQVDQRFNVPRMAMIV